MAAAIGIQRNKRNCREDFVSTNSQMKSYGPNLITIHSRRGWEWFKLWIVLVLIILVIFCLISIVNAPLDKYDLMEYIQPKTYFSTNNETSKQMNISDYSKLSPEGLREIDIGLIPNLIDYDEMNY